VPVLDPRTIDRLAELICSLGGPYQRSSRQLRQLLEGAGWDDVEYDGSARVPWLAETIRNHNDDPDAIHALLRRVIDPREYDEGMPAAVAFVESLNTVLLLDGIEVGHDGPRAFVRHTDDAGEVPSLDQVAAQLASRELRMIIRGLVNDSAMAEILNARLDEVEACRRAGAYLLAVIGTGSFIEGLLYDVLRLRDPETRKQKGATLNYLLDRAFALGWIQHDAHRFGGIVREYRNLVHPREQLESGVNPPDDDTVLLCWQPVLAVINDLRELLPGLSVR
jgi:hypothetical protein